MGDFQRGDKLIYFIAVIKKRAERDGIECSIHLSDLYSIWTGYCEMTGEKLLVYDSWNKNKAFTNASVDRKDSARGYHADNIQWVTKKVNMAKQSLSVDDFVEICKAVAKYNV